MADDIEAPHEHLIDGGCLEQSSLTGNKSAPLLTIDAVGDGPAVDPSAQHRP